MPRMTLDELQQRMNRVRYCNSCNYVILADLNIVMQYHVSRCPNYLAGYDCMHMEGKIYCECDKA